MSEVVGEAPGLRWRDREWAPRADGSLFLPADDTLFLADLHLGKASVFRARGVPLPTGGTASDLDRLSRTLEETAARRLVVLGDFYHASESRNAEVDQVLEGWRARHRDLEVWLVRGNHDEHAGDPPNGLGIRTVSEPLAWSGLSLRHIPPPRSQRSDSPATLAGHLHPVVRLEEMSRIHRRRCFWIRPDAIVLPAYGQFTGGYSVPVRRGDRVLVPVEDGVVEVGLG